MPLRRKLIPCWGKSLVKDNADYEVPDDRRLIIENIFIKTLSGETITLRNVNANTSVRQLKNEIYKTERIPPEEINLRYNNKTLQDHLTLKDYDITNDSLIYLTLLLRGGGSITIFVLDRNFLDPPFDYDFTNIQSSKKYMRGNFNYNRPYGWRRIALKVLDKFNDNSWLGVNNRVTSFDSVKDEWIVSYHGTTKRNANSIAKDGFDLNLIMRERHNKVVFQNRVKPNAFKIANFEQYFVTSNDRDIRPYGLCIKKA
ncbi:2356_t:CDS:2 [Funneliformis mosseae]|uniref:2356_t:CDS:1 n=1 Tax=Funneliformis mosseae TaxID=27381 RepID=A0A9N9G7C0_FUNMO|nr:2356_t:CDS:2 [Funneliformis mosseae]